MSVFPGISSVFAALMAVMLVLPAFAALASGGADYEIPLSELKKVEKKKTRKPERKGRKEKSKPDSTGREASGGASGSSGASGPSTPPPMAAGAATTLQAVEIQLPAAPEQKHEVGNNASEATPAVAEGARITHDPNSYVVTGKLTVIKVVISSLETLRSVRCQFRAAESDGYGFVPMIRADGSRFTYTATIPSLAQGARSLRYRIVAVDIQGRVTRSQEFAIFVKQSSPVPGWQRETTQEALRVGLENPNKPLEGFSDIVIEALPPMP